MAAVIIVALIGTVAVLSFASSPSSTSTTSSVTDSTASCNTSPPGSAITVCSSTSTSANETILPTTCSNTQNPSGFLELNASASQGTTICLQVYYYNSTASLTLNVGEGLLIWGTPTLSNGDIVSFSGASNFTIATSQNQLLIGGPNNENEGAIIVYTITANTGVSGSYFLGFIKSSAPSSYMISSGIPVSCGQYAELIAGNGQPDYAQPATTCITFTSATATTGGSSAHTIPGASFPLPDGNLYFVIAGASDST